MRVHAAARSAIVAAGTAVIALRTTLIVVDGRLVLDLVRSVVGSALGPCGNAALASVVTCLGLR